MPRRGGGRGLHPPPRTGQPRPHRPTPGPLTRRGARPVRPDAALHRRPQGRLARRTQRARRHAARVRAGDARPGDAPEDGRVRPVGPGHDARLAAVAEELGAKAVSGPLLGALALGSLLAGFASGMVQWRTSNAICWRRASVVGAASTSATSAGSIRRQRAIRESRGSAGFSPWASPVSSYRSP